jgi:hypothetical protein
MILGSAHLPDVSDVWARAAEVVSGEGWVAVAHADRRHAWMLQEPAVQSPGT